LRREIELVRFADKLRDARSSYFVEWLDRHPHGERRQVFVVVSDLGAYLGAFGISLIASRAAEILTVQNEVLEHSRRRDPCTEIGGIAAHFRNRNQRQFLTDAGTLRRIVVDKNE